MIENAAIIERLRQQARQLAGEGDNLYRVRAYRRAAEAVWLLPEPVHELVRNRGSRALERVPGIGRHLAGVIGHFVRTGEWKTFDEIPKPERRLTA